MNITRLAPSEYPFLLKQIPQLPQFLDRAGASIPPDSHKFLCVIGARRFSEYGRDACIKLIAGLKNYPIVIVSGLALGIDSIAHEAALQTGLKTIAFPGSGLSKYVLYPRTHLKLAEMIVNSGNTLLSPFERNQEGTTWTFPVRNRLMAGISHAILIVEGRRGSGTLLTADYALEFNRDVLVVPGSIFSDLSYGPHMLFERGATPIFSSSDILKALGFDAPRTTVGIDQTQKQMDFSTLLLSSEEREIITELQYSPLSASDLIEKISLPVAQFNILVSQLELRDVVTQDNGIYRIKNR